MDVTAINNEADLDLTQTNLENSIGWRDHFDIEYTANVYPPSAAS